MSRVSDYISKEFDTIIKDSREYRAYELGVASGWYYLYDYISKENGAEEAKKTFKTFFEGTDKQCEHFRKLVELSEEPKDKIDKIIDKLNKN